MHSQRQFSFDWLLILLTLLLLGLGLLMISSATGRDSAAAMTFFELPVVRQSIFAAVGLPLLVVITLVNYRSWIAWRWFLYGGMLLLLLAVWGLGHANFGARSWFDLQSFGLQPSELAKLVLIIVLADYLAGHEAAVKRGDGLLVSLILTAPIIVAVYVEPDMGTAVVLAAIWFGMLFAAGMRPIHILLLIIIAIVAAPLVWGIMQPHMRDRIIMFLHPQTDALGKDYNVIQALIGVGSGGMWGKGLGQGTQSQLFFLRVRHTDYIFAVLAEELGFVGALLLLTLFTALLLRIIRVGARASDSFGRLITTGVAVMIFVQIFINIGFQVGLLPVTGLPLPLISYGGSSLITTLLGLGLVESVAHHPIAPDAL